MSQRHTYCLTLRLEPMLEELVAQGAHERGITKSDWIRIAIRKDLKAQLKRNEDNDR
jgi:hypothetical protein